jgi:5-methylcytosine-specific restriction endonuclease McrA
MAIKDKDQYNAYMREYLAQKYYNRRVMFIAELGGVCVKCGTSEELEFDHVIPEEKSFTIAKKLGGAPEAVIRAELQKCQLLCIPCHKSKTVKSVSVAHGEGKTGVRNCRCELCAPLKNAYAREFKRRKTELKKGSQPELF